MPRKDITRQTDLFLRALDPGASSDAEPRTIDIDGVTLETTPIFDAYWQFAAERQRIFYARLRDGLSPDLTSDPILAKCKFTNAYRASDRVSQYLVRRIIYRDDLPPGKDDLFFRILLFKIFNKIDTWDLVEAALGPVTLSRYNYEEYDALLTDALKRGRRIYSPAYIMPSGRPAFGQRFKHRNHLLLLEYMLKNNFPGKISARQTMRDAYALMLSAPSMGPFLAYQYVTDLNYSMLTNYSEAEFVMAGPGALDGMRKCFVGRRNIAAERIIHHMYENQERYFHDLNLDFQTLWGRPLQLIDCQNLFCEISKYARIAFPHITDGSGRVQIKQYFRPIGPLPIPWYPPKWGINDRIQYRTPEISHDEKSSGSPSASAVPRKPS